MNARLWLWTPASCSPVPWETAVGFLPPTWETRVRSPALNFGQAKSQLFADV